MITVDMGGDSGYFLKGIYKKHLRMHGPYAGRLTVDKVSNYDPFGSPWDRHIRPYYNPYVTPGDFGILADLDFDVLQDAGREFGLQPTCFLPLREFAGHMNLRSGQLNKEWLENTVDRTMEPYLRIWGC